MSDAIEEIMGTTVFESIDDIAAERDRLRADLAAALRRAEEAERERDEARTEIALRTDQIERVRAILGATEAEDAEDAARRVVQERDGWKARAECRYDAIERYLVARGWTRITTGMADPTWYPPGVPLTDEHQHAIVAALDWETKRVKEVARERELREAAERVVSAEDAHSQAWKGGNKYMQQLADGHRETAIDALRRELAGVRAALSTPPAAAPLTDADVDALVTWTERLHAQDSSAKRAVELEALRAVSPLAQEVRRLRAVLSSTTPAASPAPCTRAGCPIQQPHRHGDQWGKIVLAPPSAPPSPPTLTPWQGRFDDLCTHRLVAGSHRAVAYAYRWGAWAVHCLGGVTKTDTVLDGTLDNAQREADAWIASHPDEVGARLPETVVAEVRTEKPRLTEWRRENGCSCRGLSSDPSDIRVTACKTWTVWSAEGSRIVDGESDSNKAARGAADAAARQWYTLPEDAPASPVEHADCDAADEKARAKGWLAADHCHDEDCEDCHGR